MGRLAKKVKKWFNENKEHAGFRYRFTGLESRLFLQRFMFLIDSLRRLIWIEKHFSFMFFHVCV
jgi:hypothetical protein